MLAALRIAIGTLRTMFSSASDKFESSLMSCVFCKVVLTHFEQCFTAGAAETTTLLGELLLGGGNNINN